MLGELKEQWDAAPLWQRILIALILPAVVAASLWFYGIQPLLNEKADLENKKQNLSFEINKYTALIRGNVIAKLEKKVQELEVEKQRKEEEMFKKLGFVPSKVDDILDYIGKLSFKNDIVILSVGVGSINDRRLMVIKEGERFILKEVVEEPSDKNRSGSKRTKAKEKKQPKVKEDYVTLKTLTLEIDIEGSAKDIYRFVSDLDRLIYMPKKLELRPRQKGGKTHGKLTIEVVFRG